MLSRDTAGAELQAVLGHVVADLFRAEPYVVSVALREHLDIREVVSLSPTRAKEKKKEKEGKRKKKRNAAVEG
jgi:hypothetical protein